MFFDDIISMQASMVSSPVTVNTSRVMISAAVVSEALRLRNNTFNAQSRSDTMPISRS